jgi:DNA polymerase-3 subunit epsilon
MTNIDTTPFALVLDTETTGANPLEARLVTVYAGVMSQDGTILIGQEMLADPGVEIPEGAAAVHGITTEYAREHGRHPGAVLGDLGAILASTRNLPVVAYNAAYDMTLLLQESKRHLPAEGAAAFEELLRERSVVDPLVLDKQLDKYRKGSRKLIDSAAHYGVQLSEEEAHGAAADAIAGGRVALAILRKFPQIAPPRFSIKELHYSQIEWKREQAASLQDYFRTKGGKPDAIVAGDWPIQTAREAA